MVLYHETGIVKIQVTTLQNNERQKNKQLNLIVNNSIKELVRVSRQEFDNKLMKIIWANKIIECAYILDKNGVQLSNTEQSVKCLREFW